MKKLMWQLPLAFLVSSCGGEEETDNYFAFLDNKLSLAKRVNGFLEKWNPRVPANKSSINKVVKKVPKILTTLNIREINLREYYRDIICMFQNFSDTGKSCKNYTGAAKALHIVNPKLFPMWDCAIREGYGCYENEEGYFNFMLRSQIEIFEIIDTYLTDYSDDTIEILSSRMYIGKPKPILKLFDEYNWVKYRKEWI